MRGGCVERRNTDLSFRLKDSARRSTGTGRAEKNLCVFHNATNDQRDFLTAWRLLFSFTREKREMYGKIWENDMKWGEEGEMYGEIERMGTGGQLILTTN